MHATSHVERAERESAEGLLFAQVLNNLDAGKWKCAWGGERLLSAVGADRAALLWALILTLEERRAAEPWRIDGVGSTWQTACSVGLCDAACCDVWVKVRPHDASSPGIVGVSGGDARRST